MLARGLDRDAVRNGAHGVGRGERVRAEGVGDRRGALGLYADDLNARVDLLGAGRDTRDQAAAARGDKDHVHKRQVAQDLERDRALARHDVLIVERMDEFRAGLLADLARPRVGFVVDVAREHDFRAVALGRGDLGDRRGARHDDGGLDAHRACCESNALRVVARRGGNDRVQAALGVALHDLVIRAAHLERTGFLLVFVLQINLRTSHGRKGAGRGQRDVVNDIFQAVGCRFKIFEF